MPDLDTSLWRVAWDGDEVAGSVWPHLPEENEKLGLGRGWLEHISVRRPWRRRGLATALIAETLRVSATWASTRGRSGVDAENPPARSGYTVARLPRGTDRGPFRKAI